MILLILIVLVGSFFVIHSKTILDLDKDNRLDAYRLELDSMANAFDSLVCACLDNAISVVRNSTTLTAVSLYTQEPRYWGQTLTRARTDLNASISGIGLFSEALIYIKAADLCVCSSGSSGSLVEIPSKYRSLLTDYMDSRVSLFSFSFDNNEYVLFKSDGNYVIYCPVYSYEDNALSMLFLIINMFDLRQYVQGIFIPASSKIQTDLMDPFGNLVWSTDSPKNAMEIEKSSERLNWQFCMYIPQESLLPDTSTLVSHSILVSIVLIVIMTFVSLVISAILHRPMYNAVKALSDAGVQPSDSKGGEFLSSSISSMSQSHKEISTALLTVSDEVKAKLFYDLVTGEPLNLSHVENTLKGISSPFTTNSLYVSFAVRCSAEDRDQVFRETKKYFSLEDEKSNTSSIAVIVSGCDMAVVTQFNDKDISLVEGKNWVIIQKKSYSNHIAAIADKVAIQAGPLYHSIMDVGFSYSNAMDTMDRVQSSAPEERNTMKERVQQIIRWCYEDSRDAASELLEHTISSIKEYGNGSRQLIELIVNEILSYPYIDARNMPDVLDWLNDETLTEAEHKEKLRESCNELLDFFCEQMRLQSNPYIVRARKYIEANYSDKNLSQTKTAEYLGITTGYLSRLFVSSIGVNYVDYVARVRVSKSIKMIEETDESIGEISERCGFASARNFIYSFKKQNGTTPGNWRKEHRG